MSQPHPMSEELRDPSTWVRIDLEQYAKRAAAELDRLHAENADQSESIANMTAELGEAKAEAARLRAALEKCANDIEFWSVALAREWPAFDGQLYAASNLAREALRPRSSK